MLESFLFYGELDIEAQQLLNAYHSLHYSNSLVQSTISL